MTTLEPNTTTSSNAVEELVTSLENVSVHDAVSQSQPSPIPEKTISPSPPMRIYTRPQILFLSNSPLVQLPPGMPELKEWFGVENEQNLSKKELELSTPGNARERRFRRDVEDGEIPSRPTFRSTLSQPSQMGNFKHHSLRASDRDRDADKDRERDVRDKDGHERLRHLSDKYDRDRLALPLSSRTKERDPAPHLSAGSSSRTGGQSQLVPSARRDARDTIKKKAGEASEDWRKDVRSTREERIDVTRRDRDEQMKSRVRDSSKSRRDPSPSRRDREREPDREPDDDPRKWKDDGKRDERPVTRRDRHPDRFRDKDTVLDPADRRWVASEERDGRAKRPGGRDRKPVDEGKDRDDRRDREREKEKEPAWMDTYVPPSPTGGILGGKVGDGGLDGIQVWKKERKEKEMKDKVDANPAKGTTGSTQETVQKDGNGAPLDEIQIFRLLMKREEEKKRVDIADDVPQARLEDSAETMTVVKDRPLPPPSSPSTTFHESLDGSGPSDGTAHISSIQMSPPPEVHPATSATLLSLLGPRDASPSLGVQVPSNSNKPSLNTSNTTNTPPIQEFTHQMHPKADVSRDAISQLNPPSGSRLLAFARTATRAQATPSNTVVNDLPPSTSPSFVLQQTDFSLPTFKSDNLRPSPAFSPFDDQSRSHGSEDLSSLVVPSDASRRPPAERPSFTPPTEHTQFSDSTSPENPNGYSVNKGSRFAKFFDAKGREAVSNISKTPAGLVSSSPGPGTQRLDHSFNTNQGNGPDPRTMDEIYAMLSSSAHASRSTLLSSISPLPNNGGFGLQSQNNLHLVQQQQLNLNRLEPLYESRLDDRNFVPDGMVPGLRATLPRNRDNASIYSDNIEDAPFNVQQRIPQQQQRNFEQLYSGGPPSVYGQQVSRNSGIPLQGNQYRGAPSSLSHQQNHAPSSQQRLPPGLANLGGRPPHEPSQLIGMPGMSNPGLPGALHLNGSNQQQPFNNFPPGGNLGYGSGPPIRGPHQPQNPAAHLSMGGHPNNLDPRTSGQNQLLGMGGVGGLRNAGVFFPGQQAPSGQMPPLLAMRQQQQQQQQLPPQMMNHIIPPHMQHHVPNSSQPTHDLMSLLMGGAPRE